MSTEHDAGGVSAARTAFREAAAVRRFRRTWLVLVVALAVVATGLGAANAAQGPRLSSGSVNADAAISRPGQRIVLDANQPVRDVSAADVQVTPDAAVEVDTDGTTVTVRLTGMLRYATDYTVEVEVRGAATGAPGSLHYAFATPDVPVHSLVRGGADGGGDRVVRRTVAGTAEASTLFQADRIQEYAVLGELVIAVVLDADDVPSLVASDPETGLTTPLGAPAASGIRELHAEQSSLLAGFLLDSTGDDGSMVSHLAVYDPADGSGIAKLVNGPDGTPLQVTDWAFVPGTGSIVAQAADQQLFLVDPLSADAPTVLGAHAELRGFLPGTTTLVVADPTSGSLLDLAEGTTTTLDLPMPDVDPRLSPGTIVMLSASSYVEVYTDPFDTGATPHRSQLYVTGPEGTRELFHPAAATSRIGTFCVSPNGHQVAVEVLPDGAGSDLYPSTPGSPDTSISYVDIASGAVTGGELGMLPDWCG